MVAVGRSKIVNCKESVVKQVELWPDVAGDSCNLSDGFASRSVDLRRSATSTTVASRRSPGERSLLCETARASSDFSPVWLLPSHNQPVYYLTTKHRKLLSDYSISHVTKIKKIHQHNLQLHSQHVNLLLIYFQWKFKIKTC